MNLMDLKPQESSFYLRAAKREFVMNPITLADEVWLDEVYGQDKIQEIFANVNIKEISRIVFRLIKPEDKVFFKTRTVYFITEDGEEVEKELGGVELLQTMISGNEEKLAIINALLENIGVSRPEVDNQPAEKPKKKAKTVKKKK